MLVEALIIAAVFGAALLVFAQSTLGSVSLAREQKLRTAVLQLTREFVERLKADDDWDTLYSRLRTLELKANPATPGSVSLAGGGHGLPLDTYYADLHVPPELGHVVVRVSVPASPPADDPWGTPILREDVGELRWGLPGDLNGDGVIDSDPRDSDYDALPVEVTFRWLSGGRDAREAQRRFWIGGRR